MAEQGSTRQVFAAVGAAAAASAAQLGLGYGLGVVVWHSPTAADPVWLGSLGWATWIAASSTVLGGIGAVRARPGPPGSGTTARPGRAWRLTLAVAAALGALLTVALVAVPARDAVLADTFAPQTVAAAYAAAGVLLGLLVATWAIGSRPVARNVVLTAGWLWALAAAAILNGLLSGRPQAVTQLASWRMTGLDDRFWSGTIYWPGALLMLGAAFVVGALAAWSTVRRGGSDAGAAAAGAAGPLLVALAYLLLAPRLSGERGELASTYLIAPYAVLSGLAGSAMTVVIGRRTRARHAGERDSAPSDAPAAATDVAAATAAKPARGTAVAGSGGGPEAARPDAGSAAGAPGNAAPRPAKAAAKPGAVAAKPGRAAVVARLDAAAAGPSDGEPAPTNERPAGPGADVDRASPHASGRAKTPRPRKAQSKPAEPKPTGAQSGTGAAVADATGPGR